MLRAWALDSSVLQIVRNGNGAYTSSNSVYAVDTFIEGKVAGA